MAARKKSRKAAQRKGRTAAKRSPTRRAKKASASARKAAREESLTDAVTADARFFALHRLD